MAPALRASFSEPLSLFTSFISRNVPSGPTPSIIPGQECDELKAALQLQLEALASFTQSAAKQACELTSRIGRLDVFAAVSQLTPQQPPTNLHLSQPLSKRGAAELAERTEKLAIMIYNQDHADQVGATVDDILQRKNKHLWDMFDEKESLRVELENLRSRRNILTQTEQQAMAALVKESAEVRKSKKAVEEDLRKTRLEADAWKTMAENVQEMQEMAIAAFERCNSLEAENVELREAMNAFAEGSTSFTVQQLQKIVANLTEEVAQYKKREQVLKDKENNMRDKENNSIIKAMRKQTRELKRRSIQAKVADNAAILQDIEAESNRPKSKEFSVLPDIPTVHEIFFLV